MHRAAKKISLDDVAPDPSPVAAIPGGPPAAPATNFEDLQAEQIHLSAKTSITTLETTTAMTETTHDTVTSPTQSPSSSSAPNAGVENTSTGSEIPTRSTRRETQPPTTIKNPTPRTAGSTPRTANTTPRTKNPTPRATTPTVPIETTPKPASKPKRGKKNAEPDRELRHPDTGLTPEEVLASGPALLRAREGLRRVMRVVEKDVNLAPDMRSPPVSPIRTRAHMTMSPAFLSPRATTSVPVEDEALEAEINTMIAKSPFVAREEQRSAIANAIAAAKAKARVDTTPGLGGIPTPVVSAHSSARTAYSGYTTQPQSATTSPHAPYSPQQTNFSPHANQQPINAQSTNVPQNVQPANSVSGNVQPQQNTPNHTPAARNIITQEKYVVCRLCADGKYRRIPQVPEYDTPFGTMDEGVTEEEEIRSMVKYIGMAFRDNPDLVKKEIFTDDDVKYAISGGVVRVRRYMQYVYAQVGNKDMVFMISCGIDFFYMFSAFVMEMVFEVEMKSYYDRLRANSVNLSAIMLRNPTVHLMSKKVLPTSINPETGSVAIWKILIFVGVQTVFGCVIAFTLKKAGAIGGGLAEGVASIVNDGADGYLFRGRPFGESAKTIFNLIGPMINRKEYTNEGPVEGEQINVDVDEPS